MYEIDDVERELKAEAVRLSEHHGGAPVVILVGGHPIGGIHRTMTASSLDSSRAPMRELLGILQAAIQIESFKHLSHQSKRATKPSNS